MSREPMTHDEVAEALRPWTHELMRRCGIRVYVFPDGTTGLVDVPAKYVAAIDSMQQALFSVMSGEGLPAFEPAQVVFLKPRRRR